MKYSIIFLHEKTINVIWYNYPSLDILCRSIIAHSDWFKVKNFEIPLNSQTTLLMADDWASAIAEEEAKGSTQDGNLSNQVRKNGIGVDESF